MLTARQLQMAPCTLVRTRVVKGKLVGGALTWTRTPLATRGCSGARPSALRAIAAPERWRRHLAHLTSSAPAFTDHAAPNRSRRCRRARPFGLRLCRAGGLGRLCQSVTSDTANAGLKIVRESHRRLLVRTRVRRRALRDYSNDNQKFWQGGQTAYSHSIVPGGLLVMSKRTRFTPRTSLMMRLAVRPKRS